MGAITPVGVVETATLEGVDARSLTKTEVARVVDGIRALIEKYGGQLPAQKATGLRQRTMSKYLAGEGFPGKSFAERLAVALGHHRDYFRDDFPRDAPPPQPPDRYPAREKAVRAAAELGIRADAIANVRGTHWKAAESRDARWWLGQIQAEADRLDARDDDPALVEAENAQAERDTAELLRQEREHLKGRAEDLKPRK
jgi:hypothetical protein